MKSIDTPCPRCSSQSMKDTLYNLLDLLETWHHTQVEYAGTLYSWQDRNLAVDKAKKDIYKILVDDPPPVC